MPTIQLLKHKPRIKKIDKYSYKDNQQYYNSIYWKKLRLDYKLEHPLCEECLKEGITKPAEHIHHKKPFMTGTTDGERWTLLLDRNNLEALCIDCHKKKHTIFEK